MRYLWTLATLVWLTTFDSCKNDCFEDPQLVVPPTVQNINLKAFNPGMTYVGSNFSPNGTSVVVYGSINMFYSIVRHDPFTGAPVSFFWSESVTPAISVGAPYPFSELQDGEIVTCYIAVFNTKPNYDVECVFKEATKVQTSASAIVKTKGGIVVQAKEAQQTQYNVPAGKYAVFDFPIEYKGPDNNYSLNLEFDLDGNLISRDTIQLNTFGL